jgi:hypothetical protein
MGRPFRHAELAELDETPELDVTLLALFAAGAVGTALISYLVWRRLDVGSAQSNRSRRLLRQLDTARSQLRRQLTAGQDERANETRIKIADLQRAIMQLEGYI